MIKKLIKYLINNENFFQKMMFYFEILSEKLDFTILKKSKIKKNVHPRGHLICNLENSCSDSSHSDCLTPQHHDRISR